MSERSVSQPFAHHIFVVDGDPDGLRTVDKTNWVDNVLVGLRALLPQDKARPELLPSVVYRCE